MKKFSQCLMCKYVFGRKCELTNAQIPDNIYNNIDKCDKFSSISDECLDCEDSCCNENSKYYDNIDNLTIK